MNNLKRDLETSRINIACYKANINRLYKELETAYDFEIAEIERLIRVDRERLGEELKFQNNHNNHRNGVQYAS